jgi:AcrR family transcriptional regulator
MAKAATPRTSTKSRMVDSAVRLLRERGLNGVTVDAVVADSRAPRGSVYHHFPGGRSELVLAAGRQSAQEVSGLIDAHPEIDPREGIGLFVDFWKSLLMELDFRAGCGVAALAVETPEQDEEYLELAANTFRHWQETLGGQLVRHGVSRADAPGFAALVVASIEGAITLCRAERSAAPLDLVAEHLLKMLDQHLA